MRSATIDSPTWTTNMDYSFTRYYYDDRTRTRRFRCKVRDRVFVGDQQTWYKLKEACLLPLGHLSPSTIEVIKTTMPPTWAVPSQESCISMALAILNDAPEGYEGEEEVTSLSEDGDDAIGIGRAALNRGRSGT
ncbi:hypothetical protein FOZ63_006749, partial [Perkinsus olseni]